MSSEAVSDLHTPEGAGKRNPLKRQSRRFNSFLRATLGRFLILSYNVKAENLDIIKNLEPPYILLPNHQMFWDPFILGIFVPHPVYYVTSDMQFRNKFLSLLLGLVGSIPKSKAVSDFETIRLIMDVKKMKGVIGVYPEGRRNWDGHTLDLFYPTAKLVKLLKIPVIIPLMRGGSLSLPRWSYGRRKGEVSLSFSIGLTPEEITELSVDEIHAKLTELLNYDEYEYQSRAMIPFRRKNRAEYLELALFVCPQCRSISTLVSNGARFSCNTCSFSVRYSEYGFFESEPGLQTFKTIREWNLWQLDYLQTLLDKKKEEASEEPIITEKRIWLKKGFRRQPLKKYHLGNMILYYNRIEFHPLRNKKLVFPLSEIEGENVQNGEIFEFYSGGKLYHFKALSKRVSGYKWGNAVSILKGNGPVK